MKSSLGSLELLVAVVIWPVQMGQSQDVSTQLMPPDVKHKVD